MSKNLRKLSVTVTAQTYYHLRKMAFAAGHYDMGKVADDLVREHQVEARACNKPRERGIFRHVQK